KKMDIFFAILMIISFMTFIVSTIGLIGYGTNSLLKKKNLPSVTFSFPVFKILFILIISSFVIFLGSMFTFGGIALLAADDEPNIAEVPEETNEANIKSDDLAEIDKEAESNEQANKDSVDEKKKRNEEAEKRKKEQPSKDPSKKVKQKSKDGKKSKKLS